MDLVGRMIFLEIMWLSHICLSQQEVVTGSVRTIFVARWIQSIGKRITVLCVVFNAVNLESVWRLLCEFISLERTGNIHHAAQWWRFLIRMYFQNPLLSKRSQNTFHSLSFLFNVCFVNRKDNHIQHHVDARLFNLSIKSEVTYLLTCVTCSLLMTEYWLLKHV